MGLKLVISLNGQILPHLFPSPCGVMGLKLGEPNAAKWEISHKFPSPCGVMGLKRQTQTRGKSSLWWFPSPCGVMGLKLPIQRRRWSVPMIVLFPSPCGVMGLKPSVFPTGKWLDTWVDVFPSPCGVMGLKPPLFSVRFSFWLFCFRPLAG